MLWKDPEVIKKQDSNKKRLTNRPEEHELLLPVSLWRQFMYERLDKLREEVRRAEKRKADADKKLKTAQDRLREAESTQILADVEALHLTPEQVGQFLSMAANGKLPGIGAGVKRDDSSKQDAARIEGKPEDSILGDREMEDDDSDRDPEKYSSYTDASEVAEGEQTENEEDEDNA